MNRTKWKLTLALLAAVLTAALLTSCFLPGSGVHPAETSIPSEPTAAATEIPQDVTLPPASSADAPTGEPVQDPTAAPTAEPTQKPTEAPTQKPTEAPTEKPTDVPTAEPTQDPAAIALSFVNDHSGTWTAGQTAYFMHFYISNGTPYVTLGDWSLERPTFTGKVTGAEYNQYGRLMLRFDFSGTKWTSQNGLYTFYTEKTEDGVPLMPVDNVKEDLGFEFFKYPQLQYKVKTQTSGCTVSEFMDHVGGYWNKNSDLSASGCMTTVLDADRVVILFKAWNTGEVIDAYTIKKITKLNNATGYSYQVEAVSNISHDTETTTIFVAKDHSILKTDLNIRVGGTGDPWTYYRDDAGIHTEMIELVTNVYKGTWYDSADNYYIHLTYIAGKPWFQMGQWGSTDPDFSGEIIAAGYDTGKNTYVFGAKYDFGKILVCTLEPGSTSGGPIKFKTGFSNDAPKQYKFDKSKQLS